MEFLPGASLFSDLVKGTYHQINAGIVTLIPGPPYKDIMTLDCGSVVLGDLVWCNYIAEGLKGATPGLMQMWLYEAGSANITYAGRGAWEDGLHIDANAQQLISRSMLFEVTGAGDLTMYWRGYSLGSNWTIGLGLADLKAVVIRAV